MSTGQNSLSITLGHFHGHADGLVAITTLLIITLSVLMAWIFIARYIRGSGD
jgi:hypothetical protein